MRKRIALQAIAIAIALVVSTLALPAPRSPRVGEDRGSVPNLTRQIGGTITVQKLLHGHLDWTIGLARMLRGLEQPADAGQGFSSWTIVDEPDPAGGKDDPPPGDESEGDDPSEDEEDGNQGGSEPLKQIG